MAVKILIGDCREKLRDLPDAGVHCCVTSPPYFGLRDYGVEGQMGLEPTPDEFVAGMVEVFREVRRVLRDDGTLWLNIGDSYAGSQIGGGDGSASGLRGTHHAERTGVSSISKRITPHCKAKDLIGIPWMLAFALRADGWFLRQDIIWSKPNPMPESVRDRCTKAHEYLFLLSKGPRYYFDAEAISEDAICERYRGGGPMVASGTGRQDASTGTRGDYRGNPRFGGSKYGDSDDPKHATKSGKEYVGNGRRNKRSVWQVATQAYPGAHFATFPPSLIEPCILAGCPTGGTVLDPFFGAGTTGLVSDRLGRDCIGIELNSEYAAMAEARIRARLPMFAEVTTVAA